MVRYEHFCADVIYTAYIVVRLCDCKYADYGQQGAKLPIFFNPLEDVQ